MSNDIDMFDILKIINRRKGKFLALLISDVEEELKDDPKKFLVVRKLIFDYMNDYTRSVSRIFLGNEIE